MSVLAKEINKFHKLSKEFIQEGFLYASQTGELLQEVEGMVGTENLETWLKKNTELDMVEAEHYLRLFSGKKVKVEAHKQKPEEENIKE